jgi:ATP-dependent DNA helicase RecG
MLEFADLEISVLKELPAGRGTIETFVVDSGNEAYVNRMWKRVREEIDAGRNVFVVAPRIHKDELEGKLTDEDEVEDESIPIAYELFKKLTAVGLEEGLDAKSQSVENMVEQLQKCPELRDIKTGILHGQLSSDEKELVMRDFVNLKTPLLVSTTVVEVGIDVPNASTMVIMDADKFGMSTLHQLRGRIGRGKYPSICFLVSSAGGSTEVGSERIQTIAKTLDGFKISQKDLEIRGEGDIIGARQSGVRSGLKLLKILEDHEIIAAAHEEAQKTLNEDPELKQHLGLKAAVEKEITEMEKHFIEKS